MLRTLCIVLVAVLIVPSPSLAQEQVEKVNINDKIKGLFQKMRDGQYRDVFLPDLTWEDVPSLMELISSEYVIKNVPSNPVSSQMTKPTREGIIALWFIEGIRAHYENPSKSGKLLHPSLNCTLVDTEGDCSPNASDLHLRAIKKYRAWWNQVSPEPAEEDSELSPLIDAGFAWR